MKKLFFLLFTAVAMAACSTYDDSELRGQLDDINDRLEAMEKAVSDANSDLKALQGIVDAMRDGVTITEVNETEKGYEIVFSDGKTATITNGSDGEAPAIAVKADTDGVYYWTCNYAGPTSTGISHSLVIRKDSKTNLYTIGFLGNQAMARPVRSIKE